MRTVGGCRVFLGSVTHRDRQRTCACIGVDLVDSMDSVGNAPLVDAQSIILRGVFLGFLSPILADPGLVQTQGAVGIVIDNMLFRNAEIRLLGVLMLL